MYLPVENEKLKNFLEDNDVYYNMHGDHPVVFYNNYRRAVDKLIFDQITNNLLWIKFFGDYAEIDYFLKNTKTNNDIRKEKLIKILNKI